MMKKRICILVSTFCIVSCVYSQIFNSSTKKEWIRIDKFNEIKIEKLIFYQDPVRLEYQKLTDDFKPEWYPAYCANGKFDYFDDYATDAIKYFHSMKGITSEQLANHYNRLKEKGLLKPESMNFPYEYIYGEIWFTQIHNKEKFVLTMGFSLPEKLDSVKFMDIYDEESELNASFKNMAMTQDVYMFENDTLKRGDYNYLFNEIFRRDSIVVHGTQFDDYYNILLNSDKYIKSLVNNNKRYFQTVKNTPEGPIVIDSTEKKGGLNQWFIVIGGFLIVLVIMVLLLFKGKKKYHE